MTNSLPPRRPVTPRPQAPQQPNRPTNHPNISQVTVKGSEWKRETTSPTTSNRPLPAPGNSKQTPKAP